VAKAVKLRSVRKLGTVGGFCMQIKRTGRKVITHLKIDNFCIENVENFNYLGAILNADDKMNI
jgi:hypothetical protein